MQALIDGTMGRFTQRSARLALNRASTLRAQGGAPIDVTIEDLSVTGCRVRTSLLLNVGEELMIGLAGVGARACRVAWANEAEIGCEFAVPLTAAEVEETRIARTLRHGQFPSVAFLTNRAPEQIEEKRLGAGHSLLAIIAAGAGAWLLLCLIVALAVQYFGS